MCRRCSSDEDRGAVDTLVRLFQRVPETVVDVRRCRTVCLQLRTVCRRSVPYGRVSMVATPFAMGWGKDRRKQVERGAGRVRSGCIVGFELAHSGLSRDAQTVQWKSGARFGDGQSMARHRETMAWRDHVALVCASV